MEGLQIMGKQFRQDNPLSQRWQQTRVQHDQQVQQGRRGEWFEIAFDPRVDAGVEVLDVQPAARHLLLLVRDKGETPGIFVKVDLADQRVW
jgi:protein-disulfide isomerase-like protein with CxxC motif